jgi:hypothetical protein
LCPWQCFHQVDLEVVCGCPWSTLTPGVVFDAVPSHCDILLLASANAENPKTRAIRTTDGLRKILYHPFIFNLSSSFQSPPIPPKSPERKTQAVVL